MGTWGPGIFSDDTALDARDEWLDLVRDGTPPAEASDRVTSKFEDEEASVATLAVAAIAWKHGRLDNNTRDRALAIIRSERDLARWADDDPGLLPRRRAALGRLRQQLESPLPPASRIRPTPQRRPEFPAGSVIEVRLGATRIGVCRVYHHSTRAGPFCVIEPLGWTETRAPTTSEVRELAPIAIESLLPSGSSMPQRVGPHRCSVMLRQAERKDSRLRVLATNVFAETLVEGSAGHGFMKVDSWVKHLEELYRTGTWLGAWIPRGAPPEPPGS